VRSAIVLEPRRTVRRRTDSIARIQPQLRRAAV
jgi:hypothetical protein